MIGRRAVQTFIFLTAVCVTSCGSGKPSTVDHTSPEVVSPRMAELPPLPDLEPMAASVRQQIRVQQHALQEALKNTSPDQQVLAREFGLMGQLLMAAESVTFAKPFLERAAQLDRMEPRWPYYLGHLHRMLGDTETAARYFDETVAMRPDDVPALIWLANSFLIQGFADKAAPLYERALTRQPELFAALLGLGRAAALRGDHAKAVEYFEAARRAQPAASAVHYPLALAYRQLGRTADAERHLQARGEVEPGPPDPLMDELAGLLTSAVVFERQGDRALARRDMAGAVSAFRRGLELDPDRPALKQKLATALALKGDNEAAVALYQELLQENPDFAEAHYSIGALFLGRGRPDLALPRFAAAIKADPTYLHARLQLAHTLRRVGKSDAALGQYQEALAIDPRMAEARFGYAVALADLGRWGAARAWLMEGRRAHPERPEFSEALARLLAAAPDPNVRDGNAALQVARALAAERRSWSRLETMAMTLAATGRYQEAAALQREAIAAYRMETGTSSTGMTANLSRYERGEAARSPWTIDPIR